MREQIETMREWARTRARPAAARRGAQSAGKKPGWMARHGAPTTNLGDKTPETSDDGERKLEL
jgi:hypothetical protein